MATKANESGVVGKGKKAPSSTSLITSTKRTARPSATISSTDKSTTSNPSEKQVPNYLKPTISSRLVESHSLNLPKSDASNKPNLNRRRSFDKPPSPSRLTKQIHPSASRQHKALVSPGPRERSSLPLRSSGLPVKSTNPSKPIPQRISKTPKEGKTQQPLIGMSAKKRSPSPPTSTTMKVANDASAYSTNAPRSTTAETTEGLDVETEPQVKEAINEKVEVEEAVKVENQEQEVENKVVSEIPPHVESGHENEHDHDHDHEVEESDQSHVQADAEKAIPTVSEEEEAKEEAQEEKIKDKHEEDESTKQDECNSITGSHPEINHSTTEEVEVKQEEEEEGGVIIEDHKSENNNEEESVVEEKKGVEGEISERVKLTERQDEDEHVESEVKEEAKEAEAEPTQPKQEASVGGMQHGKKEPQVSNDVIEETASKLLEARKNKVRALAGAFQTVIDHQTK